MSDTPIDRFLIGDSSAMQRLRRLILKVAPTSIPVLIQGPTGSGKELIAQALHSTSGRPGRFVGVNVCAIPESMFEDALFGHVRGAFTGAVAEAPGYLVEAHGGSILLDEIGALPLAVQAKLLRVVETQEFRPVGARMDRRSDFRLITASNEELEAATRGGSFRADLLQRLSGIIITAPALAERLDDVPALARHFAKAVTILGVPPQLTLCAIRLLQDQPWHRNVRELKCVVERAVVLSDSPTIDAAAVRRALPDNSWRKAEIGEENGFTRARLLEILEYSQWDTAQAATLAGVHRTTIYRRMHRLGITIPEENLSVPARALVNRQANLDRASRHQSEGNGAGHAATHSSQFTHVHNQELV